MEDATMAPSHTICEAVQLEHALRVARAQRGWQTEVAARADWRHVTPSVAERREPRPDPLEVVLAKLLNGGVIAAIAAWISRLTKKHELAEEPRRASRRLAVMPVQAPRAAEHPSNMGPMADERVFRAPLAGDCYPILSAIDRARDDGRPGFAEDSDAARLEQLARRLTEQFWSETAWVTGFVPERAFCFVCQVLERERTAADRREADLADLGAAA